MALGRSRSFGAMIPGEVNVTAYFYTLHKHTIVFRVAGVNDAGTGPFDAILTNAEWYIHTHKSP